MAKFYGQRTCTPDIKEFLPDSYHNITQTTIAKMLDEEDILHEIDTIQISTFYRYASICFKTRELLLEFCNNEHLLLTDVPLLFSPDYHERIRISIENLPVELPDTEVKNSYRFMQHLLELHIIQDKYIIINTIQLEPEFINT